MPKMSVVGAHRQVRVRLLFEMPPPLTPLSRCYMFLVNQAEMKCVADVEHAVAERFGYSSTTSLSLSIGKYTLLSNENSEVIRENDELTVSVRVEDSVAFVDLLSLPELSNNAQSSSSAADVQVVSKPKSRKRLVGSKDEFCKPAKKRKSSQTDGVSRKKKQKSKKKSKKKKKLKIADEQLKLAPTTVQIPVLKEKSPVPVSPVTVQQQEETSPDVGAISRTPLSNESKDNGANENNGDKLDQLSSETAAVVDPLIVKKEILEQTRTIQKERSPECMVTRSKSQSLSTPKPELAAVSTSGPIEACFDELEILSWPPRKGDIIAYKVLEMTDNYTPAVSDVRKARVLNVSGGTRQQTEKKLFVEMLWPEATKRNKVKGKFDLTYDSETECLSDSESKEIYVNWSALIEPRLLL